MCWIAATGRWPYWACVCFEDGQQPARVVVVGHQDALERAEVNRQPRVEYAVGHRSPGPSQRRLLASLGVLLGRAPVDVEPVLGVDAAHVDDLDGARRRALEARLALEIARLVVQQQQPAAVVGRDLLDDCSGYWIVTLGWKKRTKVWTMPMAMPQPGTRPWCS